MQPYNHTHIRTNTHTVKLTDTLTDRQTQTDRHTHIHRRRSDGQQGAKACWPAAVSQRANKTIGQGRAGQGRVG